MGVIAKGILRGCQGLFTPVSLRYPLSVFNKNSTLKATHTSRCSLPVNVVRCGAEGPWSETDPTLRNSYNIEYMRLVFPKVLPRFTGTCMTYITFFDVKFEHSNLQGLFCELLSHTTSLYLMIFVTGSYKK